MEIKEVASAAQEESRSISQNVTMGKRWAMQEGHVSWAYKTFLGYKKTAEGIKMVEKEAKIVREIFRLFLVEGKTCAGIANILNANKIPTPSGKEGCTWKIANIKSILTNEKYKGDARLQKTFTVDFLEHAKKKNEGEINSYYVKDNHQAIIEKEEWDMAQAELLRRKNIGASYSGNSPFSSRLICADCGHFYGAKVWHRGSKYEKVIYRCNDMYNKSHEQCQTPKITEDEIKEKFVKAYNLAMTDVDSLIKDAKELMEFLTNTSTEDEEIAKQEAELAIISEAATKMVKENSTKAQDQDEYKRKYDALKTRYDEAKIKLHCAKASKDSKLGQALRIEDFIAKIKESPSEIIKWDESLWNLLLDTAKVHRDRSITFKFKSGKEIDIA